MQKKQKGFSVRNAVAVIVFALLLLYLFVGLLSIRVSSLESKVDTTQKDIVRYMDISNLLHDGADTLTENVRLFAQNGDIEHLRAYYFEIFDTQSRDLALRLFTEEERSRPEIVAAIDASNGHLNELREIENRAIKLMAVAIGVDETQIPADLLDRTLSEADAALTDNEKVYLARTLLYDNVYLSHKDHLYVEFDAALTALGDEARYEYQSYFTSMRTCLTTQRILTIVLIVFVFIFFTLMHLYLLLPLMRAAKTIDEGDARIEPNTPVRELQTLAHTYNELLSRHETLEKDLRSLAHLDALTSLPNRLSLLHFVEFDLPKVAANVSTTFLSFDLNWLKETNDTKGHLAGDALLRSAADCIKDVFAEDDHGENCFRTGGDEFAAILVGKTEEEVGRLIEEFNARQVRYGVSIAVGYASAVGVHDLTELIAAADKTMYADKKEKKAHVAEEHFAQSTDDLGAI